MSLAYPTVRFVLVLKALAALMGTRWEDVAPSEAAAWGGFLNDRVFEAWGWGGFPWPQLLTVEQRAFQDGVWAPGNYDVGDIVLHLPDLVYYQALNVTADEPPTANWLALTTTPGQPAPTPAPPGLATIIPFNQPGQTVIAEVTEVYALDPDRYANAPTIPFEITSRGVKVVGWRDSCAQPQVYLEFRPSIPQFTTCAWAPGTTDAGTLVYDAGSGECFLALVDTDTAPTMTVPIGTEGDYILTTEQNLWLVTDITHWQRQLFPAFLKNAVQRGALADALVGDGQDDKAPGQEAKFQQLLDAEILKVVGLQRQRAPVRPRVASAPRRW